MNDILDLNGGPGFASSQFQNEMLKELPVQYTYLDGLETVIEQNWMEYGAYRPHRFAPALNISLADQEGYVIPHGTIIQSENLKTATGAWNSYAGLDVSGYFPHGVGYAGAMYSDAKGIYGYDRTLDGVIIPCNGSTSNIDDYISAHDVTIQRMKANGVVATTGDVESTVALTRRILKPIGVIHHQIMRETQGVNLSYRLSTEAYSVCRYGVLNIPYVIAGSGRILSPNKQPGGDAGYRSVYWRHQFLLVQDSSLLKPEVNLRVDGNGKFILPTTLGDFPTEFGRVISWTEETFADLKSKVDTYPGFNVPGTGTGGLTRRLFDFVFRIRAANGQSTAINDIVAAVKAGNYGMVKILFNNTGV